MSSRIGLFVADNFLCCWIKLNWSLQSGGDITQVNCGCGANRYFHIGVGLAARPDAIDPVLLVFWYSGRRAAIKLNIHQRVSFATHFELSSLADKHFALRSVELAPLSTLNGYVVDQSRIS